MTTCRVCGDRLDPVHADVGTHPACDPGGILPAPVLDQLTAALVRAIGAHLITEKANA